MTEQRPGFDGENTMTDFLTILFVALFISVALAQTPQVEGSKPDTSISFSNYKTLPLETINGKVFDFRRSKPHDTFANGLSYLILETSQSRMLVQIGPTWKEDEFERLFKKGTHVAAVGIRVELKKQSVFVSRELKFGEKVYLFPFPESVHFPNGYFP